MCTLLKSAALSGLIALGAVTLAPFQAAADSILQVQDSGARLEFRLGIDDDDRYRDRDHRDRDRDRDRWDRDRDRWDRDRDRDRWAYRERCSPERALWKAERMGIRRARIVDVSRRTITVRGRARGDRVRVTFGRAPHCPVIDY